MSTAAALLVTTGSCTFETFGTGTESSVVPVHAVAAVALLSELVDVLLTVWSVTVSPIEFRAVPSGTVAVVVDVG